MSAPSQPELVKLVVSSIYSDFRRWEFCRTRICDRFGEEDFQSGEMAFDHTDYYCQEMGSPLFRRFLSFSRLIDPGELVEIKLYTNQIELEAAEQGKRRVNLDPGYLGLGNFVLATGKPVAHRIYLGRGIYADLTLIYDSGSYRTLPWTYPDYASHDIISMLNDLRNSLKADLKASRKG